MSPPSRKHGPNQEFWYPLEGGIEALPRALAHKISPDRLITTSCVTEIDSVRRHVEIAGGERVRFERIISTLPLPVIVRLLGAAVPAEITRRAAALKYNVVHTVNIGFESNGTNDRNDMHWAYYADEDLIFHRASFPAAFSRWMTPPNCFSVQVEISESSHRPLDRSTLVRRALEDLRRVGIVTSKHKVVTTGLVTLDPAYIIYDLQHRENARLVRDYLSDIGIDSRGRFGEWEYFNMDAAILSGKSAAEAVL
jgi:UDP-galactopyranose mutase